MTSQHDRRIAAGILAGSALLTAASLWPAERNALGMLGSSVSGGLLGMLGGGAVLVPPLLLDGACMCLRERRRLVRIVGWLSWVTLVCVVLHLIAEAGGELGVFVGGTLYAAIGIGAHLVCVAAVSAVLARIAGPRRLVGVAGAIDQGAKRLATAWRRAGERMALPQPADLGAMHPPPHVIEVELEPEPEHARATPRVSVVSTAPTRRAPPPLPRKAVTTEVRSVESRQPPSHEPGVHESPVVAIVASPPEYAEPPTSVFAVNDQDAPHTETALKGMSLALAQALLERSIPAVVKATVPGPLITRYDVEIAKGTPVKTVVGLAQDLTVALKLEHEMVIAPVMGTGLMGFSLPNKASMRRTIYLRPLLESDAWKRYGATLPLVLGRTPEGEPVFRDLARMPHLLVAGATDSGKSVGINVMLCSLLMRMSPVELRLVLIDPKCVELKVYDGIPHLLTPVVTEMSQVSRVLQWAVCEMETRYKRIESAATRNIEEFNAKRPDARLPRIVIVVDELADLFMQHEENETPFIRLAQKARACGINMIVATQRPSVKVVSGDFKANLPGRIVFRVASDTDSMVGLDEAGAEKLLGFGDMWVKTPGAGVDKVRAHGAYVSTDEVVALCERLRAGGASQYDAAVLATEPPPPPGRNLQDEDASYERALALLIEKRLTKISTSKMQNALSLGFQKAKALVERMVEEGVLSPYDAKSKCHRVLLEHAEADH